jgi:multimeric flavodoxin WrbA
MSILTIYFSATGNSEYIAKLFGENMKGKSFSIEEELDFTKEIKDHDIIAFCYPIYGSRVPRNMREFVAKHMGEISGKKIIIFATQMLFSGDGARVFTDMFDTNSAKVLYAEHFVMPNNVGNNPFLWRQSVERHALFGTNDELKVCNFRSKTTLSNPNDSNQSVVTTLCHSLVLLDEFFSDNTRP